MIDVLGGFGHIDFFTVWIVGQEIGESTAVVEMGVGDEDHRKFFWVDVAEEGQTVAVLLVDHEAAVQHDLLGVYGENEAGAAHLAPCA